MSAPSRRCERRNPRGRRPATRSAASARAVDPGVAHRGERRGKVALGEAAAVVVEDERVMEIGRLGQAEQRLEQALDRGRGAQILAAHDQGHAARRIVDDAGEVVGGGRVLAREDRVADVGGGGGEAACRPARSTSAGRLRASAAALSRRQLCGVVARRAGIVGQAAAGAGISAAGVAVRRGERGGDVGAGAEAGIDEALRRAAGRARRHRCAVRRDWNSGGASSAMPSQARSSIDPGDELGAAAAGVEILDPQQEALPRRAADARRYRHGRGGAGPTATGAKRVVVMPTAARCRRISLTAIRG